MFEIKNPTNWNLVRRGFFSKPVVPSQLLKHWNNDENLSHNELYFNLNLIL